MNKKILAIIVMFLCFAGVVNAASINGDYKGNPIVKITSNGKVLEVDEVPPMIYDGHTLVPISFLRQLGASVIWDQENYSVDVSLNNTSSNNFDLKTMIKTVKELLVNNNIHVEKYQLAIDEMGMYIDVQYIPEFLDNEHYINSIVEIGSMTGSMLVPLDGTVIHLVSSNYVETGSVAISQKDAIEYKKGNITKSEFITRFKISNPLTTTSSNNAQAQPNVVIPNTTSSVIESKIDGDFEGWEGETIFKLTNGQIWQQDSYAYNYSYKYNPKVLIYKSGSRYKMKVDGLNDEIYVKQLK